MEAHLNADRQFWSRVLTAGGSTAIPRWAPEPVVGVAVHEAVVPDETAEAVRAVAAELEAPLGAVLLAAHAKVLAALSGEQDVVTGYVAGPGEDPLPCLCAAYAATAT
ncbi:non-ribosomal peptide synthetase, partial [Streptomyces sp. NPDC001215]